MDRSIFDLTTETWAMLADKVPEIEEMVAALYDGAGSSAANITAIKKAVEVDIPAIINEIRASINGIYDSNAVVPNRDGNMLERLEYLIANTSNIFRGVLSIIGSIAAATVIFTNANGANIIKTEYSIPIGENESDFNTNSVAIELNGIPLFKSIEVLYVSNYSFSLPDLILDNGDRIIILT